MYMCMCVIKKKFFQEQVESRNYALRLQYNTIQIYYFLE